MIQINYLYRINNCMYYIPAMSITYKYWYDVTYCDDTVFTIGIRNQPTWFRIYGHKLKTTYYTVY